LLYTVLVLLTFLVVPACTFWFTVCYHTTHLHIVVWFFVTRPHTVPLFRCWFGSLAHVRGYTRFYLVCLFPSFHWVSFIHLRYYTFLRCHRVYLDLHLFAVPHSAFTFFPGPRSVTLPYTPFIPFTFVVSLSHSHTLHHTFGFVCSSRSLPAHLRCNVLVAVGSFAWFYTRSFTLPHGFALPSFHALHVLLRFLCVCLDGRVYSVVLRFTLHTTHTLPTWVLTFTVRTFALHTRTPAVHTTAVTSAVTTSFDTYAVTVVHKFFRSFAVILQWTLRFGSLPSFLSPFTLQVLAFYGWFGWFTVTGLRSVCVLPGYHTRGLLHCSPHSRLRYFCCISTHLFAFTHTVQFTFSGYLTTV